MKRLSWVFVAFVFFPGVLKLQGQGIYNQWLARSGAGGLDAALSIGTDSNTNVFLLGGFSSTTVVGTATLTNSSGVANLFLTRVNYNSHQPPQWTKASQTDRPLSNARLAVSGSGYNFIAGAFAGTNLCWDASTLTNRGTAGDNSDDLFVARYSSTGQLDWLIQAGGNAADTFADVDVGHSFSANGIYLTGSSQSTNFFIGNTTFPNDDAWTNCFTAKLAFDGSIVWLKHGTHASSRCLALDSGNNCFVGGALTGPAMFDAVSPSNQTTGSFLAKYDSSGNLVFVRGDIVIGSRLKIDQANNIYTAGTFSNLLTIGSVTLSNSARSTIFIAKYNSDGALQWAAQVPGNGNDTLADIGLDSRTNCWLAGEFAASDEAGQRVGSVAVIACFEPSGSILAFSKQDGSGNSSAGALTSFYNPFSGSPILTFAGGNFSGTLTLGNRSLTNNGLSDVFVAWLFPGPKLSSSVSSTNIIVSWPASETGFTLETTSEFASTNWTAVTGASVVNGQIVVTNNTTTGSGFFRLRK